MFSNLSIEHRINRESENKTIVKHLTPAMISLVAQCSPMFDGRRFQNIFCLNQILEPESLITVRQYFVSPLVINISTRAIDASNLFCSKHYIC